MAGTRAGALKSWITRKEKELNSSNAPEKVREWAYEFKMRHQEELADELNRLHELIGQEEGYDSDISEADGIVYDVCPDTLGINAPEYVEIIENGVPPGGAVDN